MNGAIELIYEKQHYYWHNYKWVSKNNLTINTALSQRLTETAIKLGLITKDDLKKGADPSTNK